MHLVIQLTHEEVLQFEYGLATCYLCVFVQMCNPIWALCPATIVTPKRNYS